MKKIALLMVISMLITLALPGGILAARQKVETVDGVRVVHNSADGKWGKTPAVKLEPVRKIGDIDTEDENLAFNMPADLRIDIQGRMYILDSGNHRIQVFDESGRYIKTIGRQGQGPGEFNMPNSIAFNNSGVLFVGESSAARIQSFSPDGKLGQTIKLTNVGIGNIFPLKSDQILMSAGGFGGIVMGGAGGGMISLDQSKGDKLPNLLKVIDLNGKIVREFGQGTDFNDGMVNSQANSISYILDENENVYAVFPFQNRIEKYSPDGRLLWRADRELPYSMEIKGKSDVKREGSGQTLSMTFKMPSLTRCAIGVAMDGKGRLWVATMARQLRENEKIKSTVTVGSGGASVKKTGAVDLRNTDAYKLEVYDSEGVLQGSIPLSIFVDGIYIKGDRLFLLDKVRGVQYHEFKIIG